MRLPEMTQEIRDDASHALDLGGAELGVDGQREHFARSALGDGMTASALPQVRETCLQMQRHRIMHTRLNGVVFQK